MIQEKLNSHFQQIKDASANSLSAEIRFMLAYVESQPVLRNIINTSIDEVSDEDMNAWTDKNNLDRFVSWRDEKKQRSYLWKMLLVAARKNVTNFSDMLVPNRDRTDDGSAIRFVRAYVVPIEKYLNANLNASSSLLNLFERYKRSVEWFDFEELNIKVDTEEAADGNSNIEAIYDKHLRKFLLNNGVDYPLSKAEIDNYQPDIVADIESKNALVCEVKIYDGINRNKSNIISGVTQAIKYAKICNKKEVFLVVFNRTQKIFEIDIDFETDIIFPYLIEGGVKVHIVIIDSNHDLSPSNQGKSEILKLTRDELVSDSINE